MKRINIILLFLLCKNLSAAVDLSIPYCKNEIIVDGKIDEWKKFALFTFEDTLNSRTSVDNGDVRLLYWREADFDLISKPKSRNKVAVRCCWNRTSLNFAYLVSDDHLHYPIKLTSEHPKIYLNDGIEIYIDTKNDSRGKMDLNDYQFLVDLANQSLVLRGDRHLLKLDTIAVPKDYGQNVLFKYKVLPVDEKKSHQFLQKGYIVEIAIPFASIGVEPKENYKIKLDLCNNDLDQEIPMEATFDPSYALGWSFNWNGQSDFGYPQYWKPMILVGKPSFFETIIEKYQSFWFLSLNLTIVFSLAVIAYLIFRMVKLQKLPNAVEIQIENTISDQEPENRKILNRAKNIICENKNNLISSEDLAREMGMSLRKLQRTTREELNCTPTNFIYLIKLAMAADFIKKGYGNISQAAYEFGFSDPAYFSKLFKKHYGCSPKDYKDREKS
ncbi:MAG: helix-turn-helix domain-containing protein [Candidatus Marinimicrobia bacterium]|nr:helix-turn-helix domain-containing protein [Candidatus Neomarinimicrobiota bacterium]